VAYISNNMFHADRMKANIRLDVGDWSVSADKPGHFTIRRG